MDLAKRLGWMSGFVVLMGSLAFGGMACLDTEITDDDRQRCCTCLSEAECLEADATISSCRDELTNDGDTEFDSDCEESNCDRECDFLYW